jgi:hypothetical protein
MNWTVNKEVKFSKFNKTKDYFPQAQLYPLTDLAQYHVTLFGFHQTTLSVFTFFFRDFQLFWPEHHWRHLSSRNARLVHQNWQRVSFRLQKERRRKLQLALMFQVTLVHIPKFKKYSYLEQSFNSHIFDIIAQTVTNIAHLDNPLTSGTCNKWV